jgi:hypothetical protein
VTEEISSAVFSTSPGQRIAGYQIEQELGRGGMAIVYRARDINLGRTVALKILAPQLASDDSFRQRFIQESRAAAAVDHPHIIPVFEAGKADGELFIAMRYVSTGDVRTLLDESGALPVGRAAAIVAQVSSALDAAHAHGLVHRDVKPANILLAKSADGHSDHVYLSDFGLSKQSLAPSGLTAAGQFLGTLDYIAPEQIEGRPVDGRADLYALACATVEMLTGTPPFRRAENIALMYAQLSEPPPLLRERRPELPAAVDQVMGRALAKAPADRYATCMEFAAALRTACTPQAAPRTAPDPGLAAGRPATELVGPRPGDAARAGARSPSGYVPPPPGAASGPGGPGPGGPGPGGPGPGGPGPGGGDAGAPTSVPPGASPPASWFRDASPAGPAGPPAPSPWSREAAPSAPSQWPTAPPPGSGPPSAQQNWPSDPTAALAPASRVGEPYRLGTFPSYQGQPPRPGGRPPRRTGRVALILLVILIVALLLGALAYHLASHSSAVAPPASSSSSQAATVPPSTPVSQSPSQSTASSAAPAVSQTPSQVVEAYYQAINQHRYLIAWQLGGKNTGQTYPSFVAGFNGTASDVLEIGEANGDVVRGTLTANQTDGSIKTYSGTYTVQDGVISRFQVVQIAN